MWFWMINVDISNVWCGLSLPDLLSIEKEVYDAHAMLAEGNGEAGQTWRWLKQTPEGTEDTVNRVLAAAERIRTGSDVCVVVGAGESVLGSRAAIELLQGVNRNFGKGKDDPQIFFAGNNFSTRSWNELTGLLEGRDFSLIVVSKSGTVLESAIAFRGLRWMLERKYGTDEAGKRIYVVTDPETGPLHRMAEEEKWTSFSIPEGMESRFSLFTAAALLPMAVAGIDIEEILQGAMDARVEYDLRSFENPVWLYAGVRNALHRRGKVIELMESFEPGFQSFGRWWRQLFGASGGKDGKGIFPATAELTADLHVLNRLVQEGQSNLFETMIRFDPPEKAHTIGVYWQDREGLGYLEGKTLDFVDQMAFEAAVAAHEAGGVPVITVDCGELNGRKVGELFFFLELASGVSACVMGMNPFDDPGEESYRTNLFRLLGKPE